jgi:peptidylprolyl isomerase
MMIKAKNGNSVKVHYTGKLEDGTVFDTSLRRDPLEFKLGEGQIIPGFEQAVEGMSKGEKKTAKIPADEAYGAYDKEKVHVVDRSRFPADVHIGQKFQISPPDNEPNLVTVTAVSEEKVTIDGNHPLAGQNLTFDIQLVEVL